MYVYSVSRCRMGANLGGGDWGDMSPHFLGWWGQSCFLSPHFMYKITPSQESLAALMA